MNKNTKYELLTQEIYQGLLDEENLTVSVEHNVNIQGKSTKHQIDVYWEYTVAGIKHKVAIECKNYSRNISLGKVRDFNSVLNDIGGVNGIMVTKVGFQKGAKTYAEANGINLFVLRDPIDEDWTGKVKTISTTIQAVSTEILKWKIDLDLDWIRNSFPKESLENFKFKLTGSNDKIWILSPTGEKFKNLLQLEDSLPIPKDQTKNIKHYKTLQNHFIETEKYGRLRIKGIDFLYNVQSTSSRLDIDGSKMVKAIIKNILTNEIKFIRK